MTTFKENPCRALQEFIDEVECLRGKWLIFQDGEKIILEPTTDEQEYRGGIIFALEEFFSETHYLSGKWRIFDEGTKIIIEPVPEEKTEPEVSLS